MTDQAYFALKREVMLSLMDGVKPVIIDNTGEYANLARTFGIEVMTDKEYKQLKKNQET